MKYFVTVVRYGGIEVDAPNEDEAALIVDETCPTDAISWDDSWDVISAEAVAEPF